MAAALLVFAPSARAQNSPPNTASREPRGPAPAPSASSGTIGGSPTDICVEVDAGGYKAGHLDCATLRLQQAARGTQERAPNAASVDVPTATSRDMVTGVATQTATRQRMGNTFGTSAYPQRPPKPVFVPPPAPTPRP